jgi:hypothetical protein
MDDVSLGFLLYTGFDQRGFLACVREGGRLLQSGDLVVQADTNTPIDKPLPDTPLREKLAVRSVGPERFNDIAMPVKTWYDDGALS